MSQGMCITSALRGALYNSHMSRDMSDTRGVVHVTRGMGHISQEG